MKRMLLMLVLVLTLLSQSEGVEYKNTYHQQDGESVLLGDVKTLTLRRGKMTTGRRSAGVPQLTCVGGDARSLYAPDVVQCVNMGSDGTDFQWKCSADMSDKYRFGEVTVTCEGFRYPDDPYVLTGSCGLEYEIWLTEKGKEDAYRNRGSSHYHHEEGYHYDHDSTASSGWGGFVKLLWVAVFCFILYQLIKSCTTTNPYRNGMGGGNMGGGGGYPGQGNPNMPYPPNNNAPYPDYPNPNMPQPGCDPNANAYNAGYNAGANANRGGGGGPGFWSGGFLGYMLGRNSNSGYGGYYSRPRYTQSYTSSPSTSYSSSSSSTTRTAEGYGGTRRR